MSYMLYGMSHYVRYIVYVIEECTLPPDGISYLLCIGICALSELNFMWNIIIKVNEKYFLAIRTRLPLSA